MDQTSEEKENEPIVATKSGCPSKSFMESSDRTKMREIKEFSDVLQDIAGHEAVDKANLLLK
jgi:metal-sulfur cluster biosynthetic enzyme